MSFFQNIFAKKSAIIIALTVAFCILLSVFGIALFTDNKMGIVTFSDVDTSSSLHDLSAMSSSDLSSQIVSNVFNDISFDSSVNEPKDVYHGFVQNRFGITYVYGDCGFQQFSYKMTALDRYIHSFDYISELVPENTRMFNITVPVSSTFASIPYDIYTADGFYNKSQGTFVATVDSGINDRIVNVPIVSLIKEHYDLGEDMFFRTDKNWTSYSAYLAYVEFCNAANIIPYQLEQFTKAQLGDFLGSFYQATLTEAMETNPDNFIAYTGVEDIKTDVTIYDSGLVIKDYNLCNNKTSVSDRYNYYLGMSAGRYKIGTTANGGSLLVIGDESVHPILPFLSCHYTKIDYINPLYFENSLVDFLNSHSYDDVLTMCYTTNAINGDYIPTLNILTGVLNNE